MVKTFRLRSGSLSGRLAGYAKHKHICVEIKYTSLVASQTMLEAKQKHVTIKQKFMVTKYPLITTQHQSLRGALLQQQPDLRRHKLQHPQQPLLHLPV
jgi:hypothetical protein